MPKDEPRPTEVVIFLEGGLVREAFCDAPLAVTVLDLDEHSPKRWVRSERASCPMREMPDTVSREYHRRKKKQ
jgi:hypothetical protein